MRETDSVRPVEHQDVLVRTEEAVIKWIAEAQRRKTFVKHRSRIRRELEFGLVPNVENGALVIVGLRAELHPALVIAEVDGLVLRRVDVARPEESNVAMGEDMLVGFAPKCQVDVVRSDELESHPTFQVK